ncbi:ABC transporter permease [Fervidibacillus halotolerans]|uniref:ABC transporter permease n=1 Tax=Fervidibacillus halotolerans TaxID=2980027 RepID=A0A9E8M0U4_9BACI|nr:ABC transporter permease [Fervidibacillus halotolerans]WAA12506.1 ABC transporter permease [Fervidibacillus halotolerans]
MYQYIFRRILVFIPMLFALTIIVFALLKAAPGDPYSKILDPDLDPSVLEEAREAKGYNDPIPVQYFRWLSMAAQGDFGESIRYVGRDVSELILSRLPNTLYLGVFSLFVTLIVAIPIGIYSARNPYSPLDYFATGFGFFGLAVPNFFFGLVAIYLFAIQLGWFPSQGYISVSNSGGFGGFLDRLHHLVLPGLTLGLASTASYMRYMRSEVLTVLGSDYIRTARAKGLTERTVLYKHTLRNALIPIITLFGFEFGAIVSGAVITEGVFTFPGIGMLLLESIGNRDYPVIMALTLMFGLFILVGNLIADILYSIVDPRIRYD